MRKRTDRSAPLSDDDNDEMKHSFWGTMSVVFLFWALLDFCPWFLLLSAAYGHDFVYVGYLVHILQESWRRILLCTKKRDWLLGSIHIGF